MENLPKENYKYKNENIEEKKENCEKKNENDEEKKEKDEEKNKDDILDTDFEENLEFTEEERILRKKYLKKLTKKEILIRSIILGKKAYFGKLYNFLINIIYSFISFRETKYKAEAINAITEKDFAKFINSLRYHLIATLIYKAINILDSCLDKYVSEDFNSNIMLENFLFKKDIEFFDLFKTGELKDKISDYSSFPYFNIIDTCSRIMEYIFKLCYFGYNLYKRFFEMSIAYVIIITIQSLLEPLFFASIRDDKAEEKEELKSNYINYLAISNLKDIKIN